MCGQERKRKNVGARWMLALLCDLVGFGNGPRGLGLPWDSFGLGGWNKMARDGTTGVGSDIHA